MFRRAAVWLLSFASCIAHAAEPAAWGARELIDLGYAIMDPASPQVLSLVNGGNPIAEFVVGAAHLQGYRLPKEPGRAVNLLTASATQGFVPAQFVLAAYYLEGSPTSARDAEQGVRFLRAAADARAYFSPDWLDPQLATSQEAEDRDQLQAARTWIDEVSRTAQGHARGWLGYLYLTGAAVSQSDREAVYWVSRGAELGHVRSMILLGQFYWEGRGVARSEETALTWYRRAADQGDLWALGAIAYAYQTGRGIERDYAEARRLYTRAAELGDARALHALAGMHARGEGVARDPAAAMLLYQRAARHGVALASLNVAFLYLNGLGVARDPVQAYAWAAVAAERLAPGEHQQRAQRVADVLEAMLTPVQLEQAATRLGALRLELAPAESSAAPDER